MEYVSANILKYLTKSIGFDEKRVHFIPVSGLMGTNLVEKDPTHWYKGSSFVSKLDKIIK